MANFKEIPCPFCGRMVRDSDKFCIFCGSKLQKTESKYTAEERNEINKELSVTTAKSTSEELPEFQIKPDKDSKNIEKQTEKKGKNKAIFQAQVELPKNIVEQLEAKMDLAVIEKKKKKLMSKLDKLKDEVDSDRFEHDIEYANKISAKLEAFKSVKEELMAKEEEIRRKLGPKGQFRMDELEDLMEIQREQLIELKRQYKRRKVKKEIYEQLKLEYSSEYRKYEDELQQLRDNVIIWISKEKAESKRLKNKLGMIQARFKAREIDESEYNEQKAGIEKDLEKKEERIKILQNYSQPRKSKWI
ncbi:MAG: zinc-ribbon domain-containing protein [Promethearchaeota archaeon]